MIQARIYENIEAEQGLLGILLANPMPCRLTPDDFSDPTNARIYELIRAGKRKYDFIGGEYADYVAALYQSIITTLPSQAEDYANQIREARRKTRMQSAMLAAIDALGMQGSAEVAAGLTKEITESAENTAIMSAAEVRQKIIEDIKSPKKQYPTGLPCLDSAMAGGLVEGYTYGVCGAEKAGKTTLAHTISFNLATPHLYLAMEMGSAQIEQRNIARSLQKNSLAFLKGTITPEAVETARPNGNVYYADAIGWTVEQITHAAASAKIRHGITGFVVDYWQLVQPSERVATEEKHLRDVAQNLANFARRNHLWLILLAQMNKEGQLFGGNGLRKACDQLYMIHPCHGENPQGRWIAQDASRYTLKADIGSAERAALWMEVSTGPYFRDTISE
jgi:replicative DNA helicase